MIRRYNKVFNVEKYFTQLEMSCKLLFLVFFSLELKLLAVQLYLLHRCCVDFPDYIFEQLPSLPACFLDSSSMCSLMGLDDLAGAAKRHELYPSSTEVDS